jgi:glycosyltransferase involved in cell wall biosynthesis
MFEGIRVTRYRYFLPSLETLAYHGGILANLKQDKRRYGLIPFFILFQSLAIIKLLRRFRFDLIHAHWIVPQGACAVLASLLSKGSFPPLLCTSHGGDLYGLKSTLLIWLKRRVLQKCAAVTVVSHKMKSDINALGVSDNIHDIPMGVDLLSKFTPPINRVATRTILFVGRVVEKKGLRFLIEAMPRILEKHPGVKLRVAGDGQESNSIKKLANRLGVAANTEFLGAVANEDLPGLYRTSDVVVFPSVVAADGDQEGFGLVLVEALGCECAVVATDLPAMRDIVKDGETALIARQRDARQIAEKVIHLFNDSELRKSLGACGRRHVLERFDWDAITRRYSDLIDHVIKEQPA